MHVEPLDAASQPVWIDARARPELPTPLWLKQPQDRYWFHFIEPEKALYVQLNAMAEKTEEGLSAFFERVFASVESQSAQRLVLDLRHNGGGDGTLALPIVHGLIRCDRINQRGKLFVLIGRRTFSAAVRLAVELEKHTQAIFVGEPTGGRPNHFGEGARLTLPHDTFSIVYSSLWMQDGDPRDERAWIAPAIAAGLRADDYRNNNDPVLNAVLGYQPSEPLADRMADTILTSGLEAGLAYYREYKANPANTYLDLEWQVHLVGRRLMFQKRAAEALKVFDLNLKEHPRSHKTYDDLADAHQSLGNKEEAVAWFERSLEVNPSNWRAVDQLRSLRAKAK